MRALLQNRENALRDWGGDTTQMVRTAEELRKLGVEVEISVEAEPDLSGFDLVHVFNIQTAEHGVRQVRNARRRGLPIALSTIYWARDHMLQSDDYLRYHSSGLVRRIASMHPGLARAAVRARRSSQALLMREMLQGADSVLPNSVAELEIVVAESSMPVLRSRAVIVPNGVTPGFEEGAPPSPNEIPADLPEEYLLQVANFDPGKNQLNLLRALEFSPEFPVVFVGRSSNRPYAEACRSLAERRGNTWFVDHVPHEHMGGIYRRARVHALPSLRESPGLATLEASLAGANCVVSIHGPVTEYFGRDVWYCDPLDIAGMETACRAAWSSPRNTRLRDRILRDFTWERAAYATLQGYELALHTDRKSRI